MTAPRPTLDAVRALYPGAETFRFGDSQELCDWLLALVRSGKKTGTAGALRDYEQGKEAMPRVGRQDIALEWDGRPALVIETVSLETMPFLDVDEAFALSEGENEDLAGWRNDHEAYFARNGGFDPDMLIVCERFRVVQDFG